MIITNFLVKKRKISQIDSVPYTGEYNIDTFEFEFDDEWEGLDKTLVIVAGDKRYNVALMHNACVVPFEFYEIKGNILIGLFGTDGTYTTLATGWLPLYVEEDSYEVNVEPENLPTPTQWDAYVTEINRLLELSEASEAECARILGECQAVYDDIVTLKNTTKGYMDTTEGYKNTTKGYMDATEGYKATTKQYMDTTKGYKDDVNTTITDFNSNVGQKTTDFNTNATNKTNAFNQNYTAKSGAFNDNYDTKLGAFNTNATNKTTAFDNNASSKTTAFDSNASSKTGTFNENAASKTTTFNSNATDKTTAFNSNATSKTTDFNDNATSKTTAFNENAAAKKQDFDDNAASYADRLDNLEAVTGTSTDTFSTESTYAVGDIVVYDNKVYRCITAITTAGAWDSTKWEELSVRQELDEKEARIDYLEEHVALVESNYDTGVATGDDLDITDALNGYNQGIAIVGNTTQVQTTGKNKIDVSNVEWINTIKNADGEESASTTSHHTTNYFDVEAETQYTLSGTLFSVNTSDRIYFYDASKQWLGRTNTYSSTVDSITFTTPSDCKYIQVQTGQGIDFTTNDIQLELGAEATPYEPYTGGQPSPSPDYPQPIIDVTGTQTVQTGNGVTSITTLLHLGDIVLRSIPDTTYKDRIYHENGKWYLEQNIAQEVLDETGDWSKITSTTDVDRFVLAKNTTRNKIKVFNALSNYFINKTSVYDHTIGTFTIENTSNDTLRGRVYFNFSEYGTTTLEQFLTWISTHNIIIQYILGTPIITEITDQTLIDDLNTLLPTQTYRGHTIIQVTPATGNPAQIEIKYLKDDRVADLRSELELLKARVELLEE